MRTKYDFREPASYSLPHGRSSRMNFAISIRPTSPWPNLPYPTARGNKTQSLGTAASAWNCQPGNVTVMFCWYLIGPILFRRVFPHLRPLACLGPVRRPQGEAPAWPVNFFFWLVLAHYANTIEKHRARRWMSFPGRCAVRVGEEHPLADVPDSCCGPSVLHSDVHRPGPAAGAAPLAGIALHGVSAAFCSRPPPPPCS